LRCYVYANPPPSCAGAPLPAARASRVGTRSTSADKAATLAATGAPAWLPLLALLLLVAGSGVQRQRQRQDRRRSREA
jgi:hypothetical protein